MQIRQPLVRKSDADVVGRVLDGERNLGPVGHVAEEADVLRLGHVAHRWRLQDGPVGAGLGGGADERDLGRDVRLGDRHRERQASTEILGRPVEEQAAFTEVELVDLGAQAEHHDPMHPGLDAEVDLAAHGVAIEAPALVEERVEHGVDSADLLCIHQVAPLRTGGSPRAVASTRCRGHDTTRFAVKVRSGCAPWEPLMVRKPAPAVAQGTSGSFERLSGIDPPGFMSSARTENQQVTVVPCKRGRPARPGRRPPMDDPLEARNCSSGQDARAPGETTPQQRTLSCCGVVGPTMSVLERDSRLVEGDSGEDKTPDAARIRVRAR